MPSLVKELDILISELVRRGSADKYGYVYCISCGARMAWKDSQCAHFIPRSNMATRYNMANLAVACAQCNCFDEDRHLEVWKSKVSPEVLKYLETESRRMVRWMRYEFEEAIEMVKQKLKAL